MRIAMPGYMPLPNEMVTLTSHCARCKNIDGEQNDAKLMLTNMRLVYEWSRKRGWEMNFHACPTR